MSMCMTVVLDKKFLPGFQALMNSIKKHTPKFGLPIVCWSINLEEKDKDFCRSIYANIEFRKPDKQQYTKRPSSLPHLKDSYYKFETYKLVNEFDQVLFIDCDIVFISSIADLITTQTTSDLAICYHGKPWNQHNTGLFILRKSTDDIYNKLIQLMSKTGSSFLGDQTLMETAIKKNILSHELLDSDWNVTKRQIQDNGYKGYRSIHFVAKKPWEPGGDPAYKQLEKIWWNYYNELQE
jgi:lipopolysaccharide biosynthesis glycosyltransferase